MPEAFLNLAREDQIEALGVAASGSGLSPHILEKDIWVVWTLNALARRLQDVHAAQGRWTVLGWSEIVTQ